MKKTILCGFGRGTFKLVKAAEEDPAGGLLFQLHNENDVVLVGGSARPLGEVMVEQRKKSPKAEPCYHKVKVDEADPSKMTFELTHKIFYMPSTAETDIKDSNIGSKTPNWATDVTCVAWSTRWQAKGLQAVMPKVILTKDVVIPPGHALIISGQVS